MIHGLAYRLPSNVVVDAVKGAQPVATAPGATEPTAPGATEPTAESDGFPVGSMMFIGMGVILLGALVIGGSR